jgi:mRNA interferase MazF
MKEGNLILTPIPQADGKPKNRPAVVLREMPKYRDFLVCGVSTQLKQYLPNFDEIISPNDRDFAATGLLAPSVIRLGFLAVIKRSNVIGSIGSISPDRHQRLLQNLSDYLTGKLIL